MLSLRHYTDTYLCEGLLSVGWLNEEVDLYAQLNKEAGSWNAAGLGRQGQLIWMGVVSAAERSSDHKHGGDQGEKAMVDISVRTLYQHPHKDQRKVLSFPSEPHPQGRTLPSSWA